jgi:nucleotide-binding universal stress UspA family protein
MLLKKAVLSRSSKTLRNHSIADLLIMGSFGFKPLLEIVLGSTVDQFLSTGERPILICR